jgi:hypothetical protein
MHMHMHVSLAVGPALSSISTTTPPPPYHTDELEPPKPSHHLFFSTLRPCPHCHRQSNSHHMPYVRGRWRSRSCRQS